MTDSGWGVWADRGLLLTPDPLLDAPALPDDTRHAAAHLPDLIAEGRTRDALAALSIPADLPKEDVPALESVYRVYAFLCAAYLHAPGLPPTDRLPAGIAVPLAWVSDRLDRPPILAYAGLTLGNWRRRDPEAGFAVENLDTLMRFTRYPDEAWFTLIHVSIEAAAAPALTGLSAAAAAADAGDVDAAAANLRQIAVGLDSMTAIFRRMPEGCRPEIYYHHIRPYFFGVNALIFEGAYDDQPQTLRGGTGAQSSIVPALVAGLGVAHEQNALTSHLSDLRRYMPAPHRAFIDAMSAAPIRAFVLAQGAPALRAAYNAALLALLAFRRAHFGFARAYIFNQSPQAYGTGGTNFMEWLNQLVQETETQLV